jgi:hypothetical protein
MPTFETSVVGAYFAAGSYMRAPIPFNGAGTYTLACFAALSTLGNVSGQLVLAVGDLNMSARGMAMLNNNAGTTHMGVSKAGSPQTIEINSSGGPSATGWPNWWHWYEMIWNSSTSQYSLYMDTTIANSATSQSFAAPTSADYVFCQPNTAAVIKDVAIWNRLLTSTERNVLVAHLTAWPYGAPANFAPLASTSTAYLSNTDPVVVALQAGSQFTTASQTELDLIRDSVRKTY